MEGSTDWVWTTSLSLIAVAYALVVLKLRGLGRWPASRMVLFYAGLVTSGVALVGPLAQWAHRDFTGHMVGHILLGMVAPVLLVLSAPVTLVLRALTTRDAKRVVRVLRSTPLRIVTHPVTAATLNFGGLWLLYRTDLYALMHQYTWLLLLIHIHIFAAGYLFTATMIGVDPMPHRPTRLVRAAVLVAGLASHAILAKSLYASPPEGVTLLDGERAAQVMYYGGLPAELLVVIVFCHQWYGSTAPRHARHEASPVSGSAVSTRGA
ncbi:MAG TPA: cytochrome c oxidase assembly protein [Thermomicrobiales bacterium]|nr:cytochrome c oxidase assembly protein [Thermomicrobiales bacterium]